MKRKVESCTSQELWGRGSSLPWPRKETGWTPTGGLSIQQAPQALGNNMEFKETQQEQPWTPNSLLEDLGHDTGSLSPSWSQVRQQKGTELWEEESPSRFKCELVTGLALSVQFSSSVMSDSL